MQRYLWIFVAVAGLWATVTFAADGQWWVALPYAVIAGALAWWISPYKGGRTTRHREVVAMSEQDRPVVIYWRPGCGFCARLRSTLGDRAEDAQWVNIWQDKEAAAFVRSVNDGNEVVPTVVLEGIPVTNPNPQVVLDKLAA
ncbi:MAG: glutaredoxin domain-containing protein [Ornithinimicrobium sp.]|jgi:glutaredoxin-like protein|uniref:glutaredoxin domain-containing protein n=1 Tax=Ornithinimicrobium sp. TaxID=1977084 RepID=UPI003D9BAA99